MKPVDAIPENLIELIEKKGFKANLIPEKKYSKEQFLEISQSFSFLQYQCIIRPLIQRKHGISIRFLELLLFLYPIQYFNQNDYSKAVKAISWNIRIMLEYGWIKIVSEGYNKGEHIYGLTTKSKHIVEDYYRYMSGEKQIPEFVSKVFQNRTKDDKKRNALLEKFMNEGARVENTAIFGQ